MTNIFCINFIDFGISKITFEFRDADGGQTNFSAMQVRIVEIIPYFWSSLMTKSKRRIDEEDE